MLPRPQWSPRISGLDEIVRRFQDRWETDRQFRAMLSGALGLVMVVALCACMGVVTTVANSALAGVNGNGSGSQNSNTGTGKVSGPPSFPTSTVPPWQQSGPPAYTIIPNSQTPQPAPTHLPTATPDNQGGGGGIPTTCDGAGSHATWALVPCPQIHGQSGTLNVSVPRHPGAALNVLIHFGSCSDPSCTMAFLPSQGYKLDATGNASISYTVPNAAANSTMPISGYINVFGGPTLTINAAPVQ